MSETTVPARIRRAEAADLLGISLETVDRWRKNGVLVDAPKDGTPSREVFVLREHVDQILMKRDQVTQ